MNRLLPALLLLICYTALFSQELRNPESKAEYDDHGRIILSKDGEKFNYSVAETPDNREGLGTFILPASGGKGCSPEWSYSVMGTWIGRNSLIIEDFDNDGKKEIICSAKGPFGSFWYVLNYDSVSASYYQSWTSEYFSFSLTRIKHADITGDNIPELFIGTDDGELLVIDWRSKNTIKTISVSNSQVNDIEIANADNTGNAEIVVSTDASIYLFDHASFVLKRTISYGAKEIEVGNTDSDQLLELVTTRGKVLLLDSLSVTEKWTYNGNITNDYSYKVLLSDIDNDSMKEILVASNLSFISVYNADLQSTKYQVTTSNDVDAIFSRDVNGDGFKDIIYGDGQWGEIHFVNAVTNSEMFNIANPHHGVTNIGIDDIDNDGQLEVVWGTGWTSSGADYFLVAGIQSRLVEWKSVSIDGPFHAIAIDDIDNDNTKEIVTVSYESASGYESGIISVFDAVTKKLEWQSSGTFLYQIWTGVFDVKIKDIDNDGNKEIIIAAGQTYTGKIWVIDGITKTIESSHLFSTEDLDEFYVVAVEDLDNDGSNEIVTGNYQGYYILDALTYAVEYDSTFSIYGIPNNLVIDNIDSDSEKEIVICNKSLYVINAVTHSRWKSTENNYTSASLFDWNNDGRKDLCASTSTGFIKVIDGNTFQTIYSRKYETIKIDALVMEYLNSDTIPEIIYSCEGTVKIVQDTITSLTSRKLGQYAGQYNSLKVLDVNNDNIKEILAGTTSAIVQLSDTCYECLWLKGSLLTSDVSCAPGNDGMASIIASGGETPYSFEWSNNASGPNISNLQPGLYSVTVTDFRGCVFNDSVLVSQSVLNADLQVSSESCNPGSDGSLVVNVSAGTSPFVFQWNNGALTQSQYNLNSGNYNVSIIDSKNCTLTLSGTVNKDTLKVFLPDSASVSCYGMQNAMIFPNVIGTYPYNYAWNNGSVASALINVGAGTYILMVTDSKGCTGTDTTIVIEPAQLTVSVVTTPDDPVILGGEGTAIATVTGGTPPYYFDWNDQLMQQSDTAIDLVIGNYQLTVTDQYGCSLTDTIEIEDATEVKHASESLKLSVYPNPSSEIIYVYSTKSDYTCGYKVMNLVGDVVLESKNDISITGSGFTINLADLQSGIYHLNLNIGNKAFSLPIVKTP